MSKDKKIGELPVEGTLSNIVAIPAVNIAGLDVQFSSATIIDYVNSQIEINNDLKEVLENGSYAQNLSNEVFIGTKQDGYDAELKIGIEDIELKSYVAGIKSSQLLLDSDLTRLKRDGDNGDFQDIRIQTDSFTIEAENNNYGKNSKLIFDTTNTVDGDIILRSEYFPGSSDRKAEIFLENGGGVEIFTEDANNPALLSKIQVSLDALNLQYSKDGGKILGLEMFDDFIGITNNDQPPYGPGQTVNTSRFQMYEGSIRLDTFNQNSTIPTNEGESRFIVSPGADASVWLKSKIINGPTPFDVTNSISLEQDRINISTNYGGDSYGTSNISIQGDRLNIELSHNGVASIFALKNDALIYFIEDKLQIGIDETTVDIHYDGGARYALNKDGWTFAVNSGTLSQDSLGLEYNQPMTAYGGGDRGITFKADGPITIFDDSLLSQGIVYDANYHSVYTDRSLVDKEYVDTEISSIGTPTLQQVIDQGSVYSGTNIIEINSSNGIILASNTTNTISAFGLTSSGTKIKYEDLSGDKREVSIYSTEFKITDEITSKGVEYADDYSSNFTDRSLVDKEYVDTQMANQSAKRFDFNGNFLVYPVVFALGPAPESTEPIIPNPTLQDIENANTINTSGDNINKWADLIVAGECETLKQILQLAISKTSQILQDEAAYEQLAVEGYQYFQSQYQSFIDDGQNANPPADVSGLQSVLADLTTARNAANALYVETVSELEQLKQTYQQILDIAENECGTGEA